MPKKNKYSISIDKYLEAQDKHLDTHDLVLSPKSNQFIFTPKKKH